MSQSKRDKPRTGTGDKAKGKKPSEIGALHMQVRYPSGRYRPGPDQPQGWGAKVTGIFSRKKKK